MPDMFSIDTDFNQLSLSDLLAARDQFHFHLIHKPNVVGTAVGRYRIRKSDPWPTAANPEGLPRSAREPRTPRTLDNSEVRPNSWPAILVFVDRWQEPADFASRHEDFIPPAVYMPSGRRVPICVIFAEKESRRPETAGNFQFPTSLIGGGFPVLCDVQGREHVASIACVVSDGHRAYALTNRHVAGEPGTPIYSVLGGNKVRIGLASGLRLERASFSSIYPDWAARDVYLDLDVGLIDIDDLNQWTTQVYGVGQIGELADIDASNLSLRLIGCQVRAFGAASKDMRGEICALFYRYKSVGGFEYVSDMLIGPRAGVSLGTHPGDSGTLWLVEPGEKNGLPRPLAIQWGGQAFRGSGGASTYALATFLSTVCNELDVALLSDLNAGLPEYWGAVGHYSIAAKAIDALRNPNLKRLMSANLERISYQLPDINKKNMQGLSTRDFVPLADVPDMVWKVGPYKRGGMNAPEHANHFADMDRSLDPPLSEGATLLEICVNPANVSLPVWQRYYDAVQQQFPSERESRGLLPFRCWQFYDAMVEFARAGEVEKFVCAAGILSHYVGDACQPLHISYMFNGDPDHLVPGVVRDPKTHEKVEKDVPEGTGVHSVYEDEMIDANVPEIFDGVGRALASTPLPALTSGGHGAAVSVVALMQETFAKIKPREIVDVYLPLQDEKPSERAPAMWERLGDRTIEIMAAGCLRLAQLWESAWREGDGDSQITRYDAIDEDTLAALYRNPDFLHSYTLDTIGNFLKGAASSAQPRPRSGRTAPAPRRRQRGN
jgi:hypothetical protein